jgi:hypothetical protein
MHPHSQASLHEFRHLVSETSWTSHSIQISNFLRFEFLRHFSVKKFLPENARAVFGVFVGIHLQMANPINHHLRFQIRVPALTSSFGISAQIKDASMRDFFPPRILM